MLWANADHLLLISPAFVPFSTLLPIILAKSVSNHINSLSEQTPCFPQCTQISFLAKLIKPAVFCTQAVFLLFSLNNLRPTEQSHTLFSHISHVFCLKLPFLCQVNSYLFFQAQFKWPFQTSLFWCLPQAWWSFLLLWFHFTLFQHTQ